MLKFIGAILFLTLMPFAVQAHDSYVKVRHIGDYTVRLSQNFDTYLGELTIRRGNSLALIISEVDLHHYFGNEFDESLTNKDPYSGRDLNKSGFPSLVVTTWTGGAHCCHFLRIYELGGSARNIATVDAGSSDIVIKDLDHDGIPEIEFYDGSIDYKFASFASSPGGRTVLKYINGTYRISPQLMRTSALSPGQTKQKINQLRALMLQHVSVELPREFLESMMELTYGGHLADALALAPQVWPKQRPGLADFTHDFEKAIRESVYAPPQSHAQLLESGHH